MKQVQLNKAEVNIKEWQKKPVKPGEQVILIKEDTFLMLERNLPALYIRDINNLPEFLLPASQSLDYGESERAGGLKSGSQRIIGLIPPSYRKDILCLQSAVIEKNPEQYKIFENLGRHLDMIYKEHLPRQHNLHVHLLQKHQGILPEYFISGTPFTSGIFNKNNSLGYHKDQANIRHSMSVMLVMRNGVAGGKLHLPEYNVLIECGNNSLFIFDGSSILHGVTPIIETHLGAYRISIVFYSLKAAKKCKTQDEEIFHASQKYDRIAEKKVTVYKKRESTTRNQSAFLEALRLNGGDIKNAAETAEIRRGTFYDWCNADSEFKEKAIGILSSVELYTKSKIWKEVLEGKLNALKRLYALTVKKTKKK